MERQFCLLLFFLFMLCFYVDASPAHVLLFCSSCWMYYSVILKTRQGRGWHAGERWIFFLVPRMPARLRGRGTQTIRNAFSGGPMERPRRTSQLRPFFIADVSFILLQYVTKTTLFGYFYHQNHIFFLQYVVFPRHTCFFATFSHYQDALLTKNTAFICKSLGLFSSTTTAPN